MFAMCPEVEVRIIEDDSKQQESTIATFNRTDARKKLSPLSSSRTKTLVTPTKQSLADYDKAMTSVEQSVREALLQLDKTSDCLEAQEEQRKAHAERHGNSDSNT